MFSGCERQSLLPSAEVEYYAAPILVGVCPEDADRICGRNIYVVMCWLTLRIYVIKNKCALPTSREGKVILTTFIFA